MKFKSQGVRPGWIIAMILTCLTVITGFLLFGSDKKQDKAALSGAKDSTEKKFQTDVTKLIGRWQRPDGDYVIDIRKILDKGKLDAAYYNPGEIHVSRAMFLQTKDALKIFVELRDKGYPGSNYILKYDPKNDTLSGEYFHAGMNRIFTVLFLRKKQ